MLELFDLFGLWMAVVWTFRVLLVLSALALVMLFITWVLGGFFSAWDKLQLGHETLTVTAMNHLDKVQVGRG